MGTIANAKVTHYYNCYNGDFIGCLRKAIGLAKQRLCQAKRWDKTFKKNSAHLL